MKKLAFYFAILLLFARCGQEHREGSFSADYKLQPLKEFQDTLATLPSGAAIRILAYSGGEGQKQRPELHYCQFIGIDETTGDTVRILAAAIDAVEEGGDGKPVMTASTEYDFDKGVTEATFKTPTEDDKMMINMMSKGNPDSKTVENIVTKRDTGAKAYVFIPKGIPFFSRHFKTAVGILSFQQQPW
jgi:hypothetical protein